MKRGVLFGLLVTVVGCICSIVAYRLGTRKRGDTLLYIPKLAGNIIEGKVISSKADTRTFCALTQEVDDGELGEYEVLQCVKVLFQAEGEEEHTPYWVPLNMADELQPGQPVKFRMTGLHSLHYAQLAEII